MYLHTSGTPFERSPKKSPTPLERPLDTVNLNTKVLISTPDERPSLLKGHKRGSIVHVYLSKA